MPQSPPIPSRPPRPRTLRPGLLRTGLVALTLAVPADARAQDTAPAAVPAEGPAGDAASSLSEAQRLGYALGWIFARQSEEMLEAPLDAGAFMEGFRTASAGTDPRAMSHAFGVLVGNDFIRDAGELDLEAMRRALATRVAGGEAELSDEEIQAVMFSFQQRAQERERQEAARANQDYLLDAAAEERTITLDSGLLIRPVELGAGGADAPRPSIGDEVRLNYELRDIEGEVIESTFDAEPVVFPITEGLIAGFREGVTRMPIGSTYEFVVPPALGYGGGGPRPNGVLIFRVQALEILPADAVELPAPPPAPPGD